MERRTQAGIIALEAVLALVVVILAAGAYWTYHQHMENQAGSIGTTASALSASAKTAAVNQKQSEAALARVKSFYQTWLASPMPTAAGMEQQGYVTSAAVATAAARTYDVFTCSQTALAYNKYRFSNPIVDGNTATMLASAVYSGSTTTTIHLGLKLVGNSWEINGIDCPTPATSR